MKHCNQSCKFSTSVYQISQGKFDYFKEEFVVSATSRRARQPGGAVSLPNLRPKNDFQARKWFPSKKPARMVRFPFNLSPRCYTCQTKDMENLCVSVSVHTSVMNGTLILIVLYNSQFDERFENTPWRKVSRVVVDTVDLGGWVRMGEARKSSGTSWFCRSLGTEREKGEQWWCQNWALKCSLSDQTTLVTNLS